MNTKHSLSRTQVGVPFLGMKGLSLSFDSVLARRESNTSSEGFAEREVGPSPLSKSTSPTLTSSPLVSSHPLVIPPRRKKSNDPFSPYIITLPKFIYSTKIISGTLDTETCACVDGPAGDAGDVDGVRYEPTTPLLPEIFAKSITTYPQFPGLANPEGHPICDRYAVKATKNGTVCIIADGCGWGERAKDAAQTAVQAFLSYMESRMHKLKDMHRAAELMLKGFREAQAAIMKHTHTPGESTTQCLECGQCGTTALLGGVLVPLETHYGADNLGQPKWGFLCCSVGDCKAFCLSSNRITEITVGSRYGAMDINDCGGRLGPQIEGGPDLRNLQLFFHPCQVNDVILLVSDGVHDNFDPELLGILPRDCCVEADAWTAANRDEAMSMKDLFRARMLEDTMMGFISLEQKVLAVLRHCEATTNPSREWMVQHKGRLPLSYDRFPGKMDHSTCVAVKVPQRETLIEKSTNWFAPLALQPSSSI